MRDNLHEDLFADHAWQEMHKLLDREMPERKRRGAFWLWFLPALGLCVLMGRDTLLEGKIPVAEEKPQQNIPVIAQEQKHTVPNADNNHKTTPEEPKAGISQQQKQKIEAIAALLPVNESEKSPNTVKNGAYVGKQQKLQGPQTAAEKTFSNGDLLPDNSFKTETTSTIAQGEAGVNPSGQNTKEKGHVAAEETTTEVWSASQILATREAALNFPSAKLEKVNINPLKARQKLEWWAEAGTQLASGVSGLSGYKAGVLGAIPIGRMRLHAGLGYEMSHVGFQSIQTDSTTGKQNLTDVKLATQDQPSVGVSAGRTSTQTVSTIQLQFINLNLALYQPIGKRFGLALGGNLQYLGGIKLGEQYLRSTLFDNAESSLQLSNSAGNSFLAQEANLSKAKFRNFGIAAQGTLSYRIATRWSVGLGYRKSLQHFTKTSDLLLKPSWVDFGVRYRIK